MSCIAIRFVIPGVFYNKLDWSVSTVQHNYLVNIYIYNLLHREQLHFSAPENGHLQVVYETLSKQLHKTCIWATLGRGRGVKWARDLVSVLKVGWCGCMEGPCCYQAMSKLIIDKSMVGIILQ